MLVQALRRGDDRFERDAERRASLQHHLRERVQSRGVAVQIGRAEPSDELQLRIQTAFVQFVGGEQQAVFQPALLPAILPGLLLVKLQRRAPEHDTRVADLDAVPREAQPACRLVMFDSRTVEVEAGRFPGRAARAVLDQLVGANPAAQVRVGIAPKTRLVEGRKLLQKAFRRFPILAPDLSVVGVGRHVPDSVIEQPLQLFALAACQHLPGQMLGGLQLSHVRARAVFLQYLHQGPLYLANQKTR